MSPRLRRLRRTIFGNFLWKIEGECEGVESLTLCVREINRLQMCHQSNLLDKSINVMHDMLAGFKPPDMESLLRVEDHVESLVG
jgi:hypothetical protein